MGKEYRVIKTRESAPKAFLTYLEGEAVEAVEVEGKVYYLSMSYGLQSRGFKRIDTGKFAYVNYEGREKLVGLFDIVKSE